MTLKECSKNELIWIINRVLQMTTMNKAEYYIGCALGELEYERKRRNYDKADKIAERAKRKWEEYLDILAPYDGVKYVDIPYAVLLKAQKVHYEASALDKQWNKLMGVGDDNAAD